MIGSNLYCLYDRVAEEAGPLFHAVNDGVALRQTVQTLKPLPPTIREEYSLFRVGSYDARTMKIDVCVPQEIDITISLMRSMDYDTQQPAEVKINEQ